MKVTSLLAFSWGCQVAHSLSTPSSFQARTAPFLGKNQWTMRVGKGNGKGEGGMLRNNKILRQNEDRKNSFKDPSKVFIGNLHWNTTKSDLTELCGRFGDVAHVKVIMNHYTGNSKGIAFVKYCDPVSATSALSTLDGYEFPAGSGRKLVCDNVEEKEKVKLKKGKAAQAQRAAAKLAEKHEKSAVFDIESAISSQEETALLSELGSTSWE